MICRVAYMSSAIAGLSEASIGDILDTAHRNNARTNVTGLLMFHAGNFFQVLEGPADAVETCYAHIADDDRHSNLIRLFTRTDTCRLFPEWSMGYATPHSLDPRHKPVLISLSDLAKDGAGLEGLKNPEVTILAKQFLKGFIEFK